MTDTTDIKALRRQAETVKACGGIFSISGEQALSLLDQLEAERERADDAHKYGSERDSENESLMLTVGRLRLEIAALKAKLANPVVLSDCSFEAVSHMAHWYSEGECVAWVSGAEHVKKQILAAGLSVREE